MKKILAGICAATLLLSTVAVSGEKYTMVSVPKLRSVWFNRMEVGLKNAGEKFGIEVYQQAPAAADEAQQVRLIEDAIAQAGFAAGPFPANEEAASKLPPECRAEPKD